MARSGSAASVLFTTMHIINQIALTKITKRGREQENDFRYATTTQYTHTLGQNRGEIQRQTGGTQRQSSKIFCLREWGGVYIHQTKRFSQR